VRGVPGAAQALRRAWPAAIAVLLVFAAPAHAAFTTRGSAEQVYVTGADPGSRLTLVDRHDRKVASRHAGRLGAAVFRHVEPGRGYRLRGRRLTVLSTRSK
jgi:hypothetical protein